MELTLSEPMHARDLGQVAHRTRDVHLRPFIETLVIRSLAQAVYQSDNIGHFGLALKDYTHFTSPIRRYPDLMVHRALRVALGLSDPASLPPTTRSPPTVPICHGSSAAPMRPTDLSAPSSSACICVIASVRPSMG